MSTLSRLAEEFARFPGIGPRQARRFVYFLLTRDSRYLETLSKLITDLKREVQRCETCHRFFTSKNRHICETCSDENRSRELLLILEKDTDFENVERSGSYEGLYFILGGAVPILEKEPEKRIRSRELLSRVERDGKAGTLKELIFALSANPEGDNTERLLRELLESHAKAYDLKLSHLGRGLSTGTELEYSDAETLRNALKNRS